MQSIRSCIVGGLRVCRRQPPRWTLQPAGPCSWASTRGLDPEVPSGEAKCKGGLEDFHAKLAAGPSLQHFLQDAGAVQETHRLPAEAAEDSAPYLGSSTLADAPRKGLCCCLALSCHTAPHTFRC